MVCGTVPRWLRNCKLVCVCVQRSRRQRRGLSHWMHYSRMYFKSQFPSQWTLWPCDLLHSIVSRLLCFTEEAFLENQSALPWDSSASPCWEYSPKLLFKTYCFRMLFIYLHSVTMYLSIGEKNHIFMHWARIRMLSVKTENSYIFL